jgi:hypothetical protein
MFQNDVQSPGLLLLGLSTGWDKTLNQPFSELHKQHISVTSAMLPDTVSKQLHSKAQSSHLTKVRFDSDSYLMGVDGHASYCMANCTDQFDGDLSCK